MKGKTQSSQQPVINPELTEESTKQHIEKNKGLPKKPATSEISLSHMVKKTESIPKVPQNADALTKTNIPVTHTHQTDLAQSQIVLQDLLDSIIHMMNVIKNSLKIQVDSSTKTILKQTFTQIMAVMQNVQTLIK